MGKSTSDTMSVAVLPIGDLLPGEVGPPFEPNHSSWRILQGWDDPLCPRAGYRGVPGKTRTEFEGQPAIEWDRGRDRERALLTGDITWRDYRVSCRVQGLQTEAGPSSDGWFISEAKAGIVFRVETSRRFYFFGPEGKRRLVLFRRIDDEWFELGSRDVTCSDEILTLEVELDGDGIRAGCPELSVDLFATDTMIPQGRAGFRSMGACRLFDLKISMTSLQKSQNENRAGALVEESAHLSAGLPDEEEVGEIDLGGGLSLLTATDFYEPQRPALLLKGSEGLVARTWDGKELWRFTESVDMVKISERTESGSRRVLAMVGDRWHEDSQSVRGTPSQLTVTDEIVALDGATGRVLHRTRLPETPDVEKIRRFDFSYETGCLQGAQPLDFVVRQWRKDTGGGGFDLWAYGADLSPLWHQRVDPPYGHHNAVHLIDLDGDGRSEVMAGGTLVSSDGRVLSVHDRAEETKRIRNAGHYDAVVVGFLAKGELPDPVAFLMAGSAGVYVVDPLTGRTRACHRTGHAQWGLACRVREDLPGLQVLNGTRWGNYGILTLFSCRGERLWSMQRDYIVQGTSPVQWTREGPQHIWWNTSREAMGLYDGKGRLAKRLDKVRRLWGDRTPMDVTCLPLRRTPDGTDLLGIQIGDNIRLFAARDGTCR